MNGLSGVVIDGVTGAGKSSVVAELRRLWRGSHTFVDEERTLGEFMSDELRDERLPPHAKLWRLQNVLEEMRSRPAERFVLERFHPSYFALLPDWGLYAAVDAELAKRAYGLVILTVPEAMLSSRTLLREDRAGTSWSAEMIEHFGSESSALRAIHDSQQRRLEVLALTLLPALVIDTSAKTWSVYAEQIVRFSSAR